MNLLERAKGFIAAKAAKIALTVVPLAALTAIAAPAHAGVIFSNSVCSVIVGTGTCNSDEALAIGGNPNGNWIEAFTNGSINSAGGTVHLSVTGSASGGSFGIGEVIPVSWDFIVGNSGSGGTVNWSLLYQINTDTGSNNSLSVSPGYSTVASGSAAVGTEVMGSGSIIASNTNNVTGFSIDLDVSGGSGSFFNLTVPGGQTLDLNPLVGAAATPEPASFLLVGAGLVALSLRRKKKQA